MQTITTNTADILAAMFSENTGAHFLDSGGAYGRHWERNQGKTTRDFLNAPRVTIDGDYLARDSFHFLNDCISYDEVMDAAFQAYLDKSEEHYLTDMEQFPITLGVEERDINTINTYNHDTALSQTLQFTYWQLGGQTYLALQVHGGCDVRGGYTRPRIFTGDWEQFLDFGRVSVSCSKCVFYADYSDGGYRVEYSECGSNCREYCGNINNHYPLDAAPYTREWKLSDNCPCCGGQLG